MRLWPFSRPAATAVATEDALTTEDLLRRNVEDLMVVHERRLHGPAIAFGGDLLVTPDRALALLGDRFRPFGFTPFLRKEGGRVWVQATPSVEVPERSGVGLNVLLFVLTCLSTLAAGSGAFFAFNPLTEPWRLLAGAPFAFTLLAILGTHEFGHYFTARYHRASVSLPYFIPAPPPFLFGTLGAVIRMRSPARNRNALFDIAAAGPIAGLVIAIPALVIGLRWSTVAAVPPSGTLTFGDSILMRFLTYLTFGPLPAGSDVFIHPVGLAGWIGLFVTALNLFPVGQLDGGRIAYALFGARHRMLGVLTFVALLALGLVSRSPSWVVWAGLLYFVIGFHHGAPLDDVTPLTPGRRIVGAACLVLLLLLVPPVPIS